MSKKIICPSCGAEYEERLVRCPYCGTATLNAEENEYMGKLEDIRKDLEDYSGEGEKQVKSKVGKTVIIVILVMIIIAVLIIGSICLDWLGRQRDKNNRKDEFLNNQGITTSMLKETYYEM